jgi:hypothetical protein
LDNHTHQVLAQEENNSVNEVAVYPSLFDLPQLLQQEALQVLKVDFPLLIGNGFYWNVFLNE